MHHEVLTPEQRKLLPLIKSFSGEFGLVGGTAAALQIGHRFSIDFDLFTLKDFDSNFVQNQVRQNYPIEKIFVDRPQELTLVTHDVKLTFYKYPFAIAFSKIFEKIIKIPDLLTLAAMKAFALGKRAKWKDYVDLFFIFKKVRFADAIAKAEKLFWGEFNQKLFREQLAYYRDVDFTEKVIFLPGFETDEKIVQKTLTQVSLAPSRNRKE